MNRKIIITFAILCSILAFLSFEIFNTTNFYEYIKTIAVKANNDENYEYNLRIILGGIGLIFPILSSVVCFKVAKRKNLEPLKWAKYGFMFNIFAVLYLLFFTQTNINKNA